MERTRIRIALPAIGAALALVVGLGGEAVAQARCGRITTVLAGESVEEVARRCGVTVEDLTSMNARLDTTRPLVTGSELLLPVNALHVPPSTAARPGGGAVHVVAAGETLSGIALRYGTTVEALLGLNAELGDPNRIVEGARILLPGAEGAAPGADRVGPGLAVAPDEGMVPGVDVVPSTPTPVPARRTDPEDAASARVQISPQVAFRGAQIVVHAVGFDPDERVTISVGGEGVAWDVVSQTTADPLGVVNQAVTVPDWVEPTGSYRIGLVAADSPDRVFSGPFTVRGPGPAGGTVQPPVRMLGTAELLEALRTGGSAGVRARVAGTLERGASCSLLAMEDGGRFALVGDLGGLAFGEWVLLDVEAAPGRATECREGQATLEVRGVVRR